MRFSIVGRVLQKLGWDIWNPKEVATEFLTVPNEDKSKVDVALFKNQDNRTPSVYIEVKAVGRLVQDLKSAERQLRDYNRNNTAQISIITDGISWRFYYSQTGGEFSDKCFKVLSIDEDIDSLQEQFSILLSKQSILSETAKMQAESYLNITQKQRAIEDSLIKAQKLVSEHPFPSLPEALIQSVKRVGFTITLDEAIKFIQEHNSNEDSILSDSQKSWPPPPNPLTNSDQFGRTIYSDPDKLPDLHFTKVESGFIGNESANNWNRLLDTCIRQLVKAGWTKDKLRSVYPRLNIEEGHHNQSGFRLITGTRFSIQGVDANNAAKALVTLTALSGIRMEVNFHWKSNQGAAYPNRKGRIVTN